MLPRIGTEKSVWFTQEFQIVARRGMRMLGKMLC